MLPTLLQIVTERLTCHRNCSLKQQLMLQLFIPINGTVCSALCAQKRKLFSTYLPSSPMRRLAFRLAFCWPGQRRNRAKAHVMQGDHVCNASARKRTFVPVNLSMLLFILYWSLCDQFNYVSDRWTLGLVLECVCYCKQICSLMSCFV
jgi:hypothetical protein